MPGDLDPFKVITKIDYFDGLGRPVQSNVLYGSPTYKDIITPINYDEFGRESVKYLPYSTSAFNWGRFYSTANEDQRDFYGVYFPGDTANSKSVFESSPLNRIIQQGAPGTTWQPENGHVIRYEYNTNNRYDVLIWSISGNACINTGGESYSNHNYYYSGKLYKNVVKDENWVAASTRDSLLHTSEEYKDLQGNVVLKRSYVLVNTIVTPAETYYIYDDFGLLRYVMPPQAVSNLGTLTTLTDTSDLVKKWCYYYQYDERKRMIIKQLPGAEPVYMVYDPRDRLVATQDGNMRDSAFWLVTKYDELNRPVLTGRYTSALTLSSMRSAVDTYYSNINNHYYTSRNYSWLNKGYDLQSFPNDTSMIKYYTITYYDDYNYSGVKVFDLNENVSGYSNGNLS